MQAFNYRALDAAGKQQKGVLEADSMRMVRQQLREKGLMPTEVTPVRASRSLFQLKSGVGQSDLMLVTRQLATLIGSGMALDKSLQLMGEQAENVVVKRLITSVRSRVSEGQTLAYAFKNSPYAFPSDYIATIAAGEETGHLQEVLERLADEVEARGKARQSLMAALLYPLIMLVVAVTVIVLLIIYVVPQMTRVFSDMSQELPALTIGLIAVSDWLQAYGIYLLVLLVSLTLTFVIGMQNEHFKMRWDTMLLNAPRVSYWVVMASVGGWGRSLGMLLGSGVPVLESMRIAAERVHNLALRAKLESVSEMVREGSSLNRALFKVGTFPPFLVHMVSSGESSGTLDQMLLKVSDYYDQRLKTVMDTSLKLFEPLLIVVMGGIVLLIVMAVLVPIIQMNQLV